MLLAVVEHDQADGAKALTQAGDEAIGIERRHRGVADHDRDLAGRQGGIGRRVGEHAARDEDVVAAVGDVDPDPPARRRWGRTGGAIQVECLVHRSLRPASSRRRGSERQLLDDGIDQHLQRPAAGLDLERRGLAIERLALGAQLGQPGRGVRHLQQRPPGVVAQAVKQRLRIRLEVDAHRPLVEQLAVARPEDDAAAGGDDALGGGDELLEHRALGVAELLFAFGREEVADATAEALLEQRVAIREVDTQLPGQPPPDGRLADRGQADQADSEARRGRGRRLRHRSVGRTVQALGVISKTVRAEDKGRCSRRP